MSEQHAELFEKYGAKDTDSLIEKMDSIIVQAENKDRPDGVSFWFMHDNHTFTKIYGTTLDEILANADAIEAESSYGMLCSVFLLCGGKEVRRVGKDAHGKGSKDPKDKWNEGKLIWRAGLEADPDVMRLLPTNKEPDYEKRFSMTFGEPLKKFWDKVSGFDICAFDDWIQSPDGVSICEHVTAKHGADAADLIAALIGLEPGSKPS